MSSSTAAASQDSAVGAFRVVWVLWIEMSRVYAAGYFRVVVLDGPYSQGLLLGRCPRYKPFGSLSTWGENNFAVRWKP